MSGDPEGILPQPICETPVAVLDFETTGLEAGYDRVVEVSVVRIDPGCPPRLALDTLVNPDRPMAATFVHGITGEAVSDAPRFEDMAGDLLRAIAGCVLAAHNVYFDLKFLRYELGRLSLFEESPHVCTMYSRPLLGLRACSLDQACVTDDIGCTPAHSSRSDAMATAALWVRYGARFRERGITTFRDLTRQGRSYKFFRSFRCRVPPPHVAVPSRQVDLKPRVATERGSREATPSLALRPWGT
jgi:DNA polymerase-3 subunit epsilon